MYKCPYIFVVGNTHDVCILLNKPKSRFDSSQGEANPSE